MIYGYQQKAYDSILKTAVSHRIANTSEMAIRPRFHRLVIGESGSGKTFLAREAARVIGARTLLINCASWTIIGGRETPTWEHIVNWLTDTPSNVSPILVLDEIDKVNSHDSWTRYLRTEVFSLIDGIIPSPAVLKDSTEDEVLAVLKKTLVIACGAFQEAFETKPTAGFVTTGNTPTSSDDLSKYLQRELINRFTSDIIIIPQLGRDDYINMLEDSKKYLPSETYEIVYREGIKQVDLAVTNKTAGRFLENLLADAIYTMVDDEDIMRECAIKPVVVSDETVDYSEKEFIKDVWDTAEVSEADHLAALVAAGLHEK